MKILIVGVFLGLTLLACTPQTKQEQGEKVMKQLVTLYAVDPKPGHIAVTVTGHGCTLASQFKIEAVQEGGVCRVSVYRTQIDRCRRSAMPKSLEIPWDAKQVCGDASIEINNPQKPGAKHPLLIPGNSK